MATKKEIEKLENLLEWKRELTLFESVKLFNQKVSPTLTLREFKEKGWEIEMSTEDAEGHLQKHSLLLQHKTLINLGLAILDAVNFANKR